MLPPAVSGLAVARRDPEERLADLVLLHVAGRVLADDASVDPEEIKPLRSLFPEISVPFLGIFRPKSGLKKLSGRTIRLCEWDSSSGSCVGSRENVQVALFYCSPGFTSLPPRPPRSILTSKSGTEV